MEENRRRNSKNSNERSNDGENSSDESLYEYTLTKVRKSKSRSKQGSRSYDRNDGQITSPTNLRTTVSNSSLKKIFSKCEAHNDDFNAPYGRQYVRYSNREEVLTSSSSRKHHSKPNNRDDIRNALPEKQRGKPCYCDDPRHSTNQRVSDRDNSSDFSPRKQFERPSNYDDFCTCNDENPNDGILSDSSCTRIDSECFLDARNTFDGEDDGNFVYKQGHYQYAECDPNVNQCRYVSEGWMNYNASDRVDNSRCEKCPEPSGKNDQPCQSHFHTALKFHCPFHDPRRTFPSILECNRALFVPPFTRTINRSKHSIFKPRELPIRKNDIKERFSYRGPISLSGFRKNNQSSDKSGPQKLSVPAILHASLSYVKISTIPDGSIHSKTHLQSVTEEVSPTGTLASFKPSIASSNSTSTKSDDVSQDSKVVSETIEVYKSHQKISVTESPNNSIKKTYGESKYSQITEDELDQYSSGGSLKRGENESEAEVSYERALSLTKNEIPLTPLNKLQKPPKPPTVTDAPPDCSECVCSKKQHGNLYAEYNLPMTPSMTDLPYECECQCAERTPQSLFSSKKVESPKTFPAVTHNAEPKKLCSDCAGSESSNSNRQTQILKPGSDNFRTSYDLPPKSPKQVPESAKRSKVPKNIELTHSNNAPKKKSVTEDTATTPTNRKRTSTNSSSGSKHSKSATKIPRKTPEPFMTKTPLNTTSTKSKKRSSKIHLTKSRTLSSIYEPCGEEIDQYPDKWDAVPQGCTHGEKCCKCPQYGVSPNDLPEPPINIVPPPTVSSSKESLPSSKDKGLSLSSDPRTKSQTADSASSKEPSVSSEPLFSTEPFIAPSPNSIPKKILSTDEASGSYPSNATSDPNSAFLSSQDKPCNCPTIRDVLLKIVELTTPPPVLSFAGQDLSRPGFRSISVQTSSPSEARVALACIQPTSPLQSPTGSTSSSSKDVSKRRTSKKKKKQTR